jgi:hypothetical protein
MFINMTRNASLRNVYKYFRMFRNFVFYLKNAYEFLKCL